jgi:hypothetical protein
VNESTFVRVNFEQARGKTGVPHTTLPLASGYAPDYDTLLRDVVESLRHACASSELGHGEDIMPGEGMEGYSLHALHGGPIEDLGGGTVTYEDVEGMPDGKVVEGARCIRLVLCWGVPGIQLLARTKGSGS